MRPFAGDLEHMILDAQDAASESIDVGLLDINGKLFCRILEVGGSNREPNRS